MWIIWIDVRATCETPALIYRQNITSITAVQRVLRLHREQAQRSGNRHLAVLSLPDDERAPDLTALMHSGPRPSAMDPSDRISRLLGTDQHIVIWSSSETARLSELAAALGALAAGGLALLVVDRLATQQSALLHRVIEMIDAEATSSRDCNATHDEQSEPAALANYSLGFQLSQQQACDLFEQLNAACKASQAHGESAHPLTAARVPRLAEQSRLLELARQHIGKHEATSDPSLTIVTGLRGSGKSALLGRLGRDLEALGHRVLVTGPSAMATHTLLRFKSSGRFTPVDQALNTASGTLFIDEAASLPLEQLERLVRHHACTVMATTTDGYESGGRAFDVLATTTLTSLRPGTLHLETRQPMRWHADDQIDPLIRRALYLHDSTSTNTRHSREFVYDKPCVRELGPEELRYNEPLAGDVIDLLNRTHYQSSLTATDDMLSGRTRLHVVENSGLIMGAVTTVTERALENELHDDILANRRRLPDRLLPQLLARCANDPRALQHNFQRIVRIAVDPRARRHGIGRMLVEHLLQDTDTPVSIGAVFADDAGSSAFWEALGFSRFHLGHRVNPRSGQRSAAVLRSTQPDVSDALDIAMAIFQDNNTPHLQPPIGSSDQKLLLRLAHGERGLAETRAAVHRLWCSTTGNSLPAPDTWPDIPQLTDAMTRRQRERAVIEWVRSHVMTTSP